MSVASLLVEWSDDLGDRFDVAEQCGAIEWCADVLDSKRRIVLVLRELVREQRVVDPDAAETIGRLEAARDVLAADVVDVRAVDAILVGAIRALGGRA